MARTDYEHRTRASTVNTKAPGNRRTGTGSIPQRLGPLVGGLRARSSRAASPHAAHAIVRASRPSIAV
eukprot:2275867-Prymnesium_polylepis.1